MDILLLRDLVVDEYGNYYIAMRESENEGVKELTLVNAFIDLSFRRILTFDDSFKKEFAEYEHKYLGQQAMDILKSRIEQLSKHEVPGGIYKLSDVLQEYKVKFIPFFERNPQVCK
mgnify:CR=1 FL=1|jgi:hypothetical protein